MWLNPMRGMLSVYVWQAKSVVADNLETVRHIPVLLRRIPKHQVRYIDQTRLIDVQHPLITRRSGVPLRDTKNQKILKEHAVYQITLVDGSSFFGNFK